MVEPGTQEHLERIIDTVVFEAEEIHQQVVKLGEKITRDYRGKELLVIGVLRGAFMFMADLVRQIEVPLCMDFMLVSSYENSRETSGVVRIIKDTKENIYERDVLIVEDIVDSGLTYHNLRKTLETRDPASLSVCSLLNKEANRQVDVEVDYYGFDSPGQFMVGYGLDYKEYYRECPFIFKPTEEALRELD